MKRFILSIDGGGIRGLLPATVLVEVERRVQKPAAEIFDLMTGTSTGGLTVASLGTPDSQGKPKYSASQIVDFYKQMGPHMSKPGGPLGFLRFSKYSDKFIEGPLQQLFQETTLKDTLSKLLFTTFDINAYSALFFKNWREDQSDVKVRDVVKATMAAPTFFRPAKVQERLLIDGAVVANNPAVCAFAEATRLFPGDSLVMLSLGTGYLDHGPPLRRHLGALGWVTPLVNIMLTSSRNTVSYQMGLTMGERYIRLSKVLQGSEHSVDDASPQHMAALQREAAEMVADSKDKIDLFIKLLSSRNVS